MQIASVPPRPPADHTDGGPDAAWSILLAEVVATLAALQTSEASRRTGLIVSKAPTCVPSYSE